MDRRRARMLGLLLIGAVLATFVVCLVVVRLEELKNQRKRERESEYASRKRARRNQPREILLRLDTEEEAEPATFSCTNVGIHRLPISVSWQQRVMRQWTNDEFVENLRLTKDAFQFLLDRVGGDLTFGACDRGGKRATPPWALLGATLSWLAGGRPSDFREKYGMRKSCFKARRWDVLDAIVKHLEAEMVQFPRTAQALDDTSLKMSRWCHFQGVIGAIDGLIVRMKSVSPKLQRIMRCDRHDCYGLNLQAMVNADDQFIWFSAERYASCADGLAFRVTKLWRELVLGKLCTQLGQSPGKYFILGDNAYPLRHFLLHPYRGAHAPGTAEDTWNLRMSAARSAIERAFGQLVLSWQIIRNGIDVKTVERAQLIVRAVICLHNLRKRFRAPDLRRTGAAVVHRDLNTLEEAIEWVRESGSNGLRTERLPEDRRMDAITSAMLGTSIRNQLANGLRDAGFTRSGADPVLI